MADNGHKRIEISDETTPSLVISVNGKDHEVDPLEVVATLNDSGVLNQSGGVGATDAAALQAFRDAIGLPQLGFSQTLQVMAEFQEYVEGLEKKVPWLRSLLQNTGGGSSPSRRRKKSSGSTRGSRKSARKSR